MTHLSLVVSGQSVGANLESAIEAGDVIENQDGTLSLANNAGDTGDEDAEGGTFIRCAGDFPPLVTYAPDKGAPPHLDTDRSLSSA
jgi:hypothetical protein